MTWIVGGNAPFGSAYLISDIQVTFRAPGMAPRYLDCLQKVYPLGRFILGGFSGPVRVGLYVLDRLGRELSSVSDNHGLQLDVISATWLPRLLRRYHSEISPAGDKRRCQIILASAHPTKNCGDLPMAWPDVYVYLSPRFRPVPADRRSIVSIGQKGPVVDEYANALDKSVRDPGMLQTLISGPANHARSIAHAVDSTVRESPTAGISVLFQAAMVTRGSYSIQNHEYTVYGPGDHIEEIKFPPLAKSYDEFVEICRAEGLLAEASVC